MRITFGKISLWAFLAFLLIWSPAEISSQPSPSPPLKVFVSILPQAYFVERVGGSHVSVEVLVGPGKSHHTYEPTPHQLALLSESDVFFRIGVPFENSLVTKIAFTMDKVKVVETQKGTPLRYLPESGGKGIPDPHIWMDPKLVKLQAAIITETLARLDTSHAVEYTKHLETFQKDLDQIDAEIAGILAPLKGKEVYVFHPAYGYFLESYGLKQTSIEVEGKEPGPRHLAEMVDKMRQDQVKVLFVQPQFSSKTAKAIASEAGASVVTLDPLSRDYLENLKQTALKIREAFSE
jgi:zinc transport system substrate-binding protein